MSYDAIEARTQSILQDLTDVFEKPEYISRGDPRVLQNGGPTLGMLRFGPFTEKRLSGNKKDVTWTVLLDLIVPNNEFSAVTTLGQKRDAVINYIAKYPTLNHLTTSDGQVVGTGDMSSGEMDGIPEATSDTIEFLFVTISIPVLERTNLSNAES